MASYIQMGKVLLAIAAAVARAMASQAEHKKHTTSAIFTPIAIESSMVCGTKFFKGIWLSP